MRGCSAVTAGKQCDALLIELECFTGFDEDKLLAIKPTVWMKAWRELSANIWVRIQCCSCAMCGPALEKRFSLSDSRRGSQSQGDLFADLAPPARPKGA